MKESKFHLILFFVFFVFLVFSTYCFVRNSQLKLYEYMFLFFFIFVANYFNWTRFIDIKKKEEFKEWKKSVLGEDL